MSEIGELLEQLVERYADDVDAEYLSGCRSRAAVDWSESQLLRLTSRRGLDSAIREYSLNKSMYAAHW